jgi:hypothetical protein
MPQHNPKMQGLKMQQTAKTYDIWGLPECGNARSFGNEPVNKHKQAGIID